MLDSIVYPALELAVRDRRRGRLDAESLEELDETIEELIDRSGRGERPDAPHIVFVPARGPFDILATRLAAGAVNVRAPGSAATVQDVSGLTALGTIEDLDLEIGQLVFLTVTGISDKLVCYLVKRAKERLPKARLVFIDLTRPAGSIPQSSLEEEGVDTFGRLADFAAAGRPTQETSEPPESVEARPWLRTRLEVQSGHN